MSVELGAFRRAVCRSVSEFRTHILTATLHKDVVIAIGSGLNLNCTVNKSHVHLSDRFILTR